MQDITALKCTKIWKVGGHLGFRNWILNFYNILNPIARVSKASFCVKAAESALVRKFPFLLHHMTTLALNYRKSGLMLPAALSEHRATMTSLIAILDLKGKPLIQRSYRDDVPPSFIERFLPLVLEIEEEGQQVTPCFSNQGVNYMHVRHSNLYRK
jgi:hypothetical protein